MKLTKASREIIDAIRDAVIGGKALGGLLAGFAAAAFTGCSEHPSAHTMGKYIIQEQTDEKGEQEQTDEKDEQEQMDEKDENAKDL